MTDLKRTSAEPLNARQLLRNEFLRDFASAVLSRLSNPADLGPIVIRSSQGLFSIDEAVRRTCYMADTELLTMSTAWASEQGYAPLGFVRRTRRQRRVLFLTDWQNGNEQRSDILKEIAEKRDPEVIVVILATLSGDFDPDMEVGEIFGRDLWQEMSYIEVDEKTAYADEARAA